MATIKDELDNIGSELTRKAKKYALPNKKTGALDRSFSYKTVFISNNKFQIVVNEKFYGKYLNAKTGYMDKAISETIPNGLDSIIDTIVGEILNDIKKL